MTENQSFIADEEDEMYEHHRIVADRGQTLMRLDHYLKHHLSNITRTKLQNAIETESVKVNNKPVKSSYKIKPLDVITVSMPHPPRETDIVAENIPLTIIYEDQEVLVLNKPAGMVVHPAYGNWSGTVVNALVYHFQHLPTGRNGEARPGLIHRIDKDTSGLLVIAKTEYSMAHIARQFFEHTTERTYFALVWGEPKTTEGTIVGHIGRSARDRKVMDVYEDGSQGKHAVTHYKVLKTFKYVSLVQCNLETGRTHQIRVHFQHIGHPLFGDSVYGGDKILRGTTSGSYRAFVENCFQLMPRQALHAKSLGFEHPKTKKWMQFDSELPEDFQAVLAKWEKYASE
ncbi:RluA family pseudouridine synthase [Runella slithyformis]|uniref:Pseudouridine synthase n=1 Tax=Runella slithyformis (strain ATCC 29530 / DSM 19594 / LMG 11500 / NCIMB 11436 / LSU 4) TaxID=761193 RepID=A0A7U4E7M9_RUNSL|nr:RluA family pseudouridine synthase [Runella slithyformis]AEI50823.1 pseudouridine synthase, RluA family [Runella slithyformis DSM 19594]